MTTETRPPVLSIALCEGARTSSRVVISFMGPNSLQKGPCLGRKVSWLTLSSLKPGNKKLHRADPTDRKPVFARAFLRNAFHVLCPDVDPGTEHRAKLREQCLFSRGAEVRRTHDVQHDLVNGWLHHLELLEPGYCRQGALHQRHPRNHRAVTSLEIVGDASDHTFHERQAAPTRAAPIRWHPHILDTIAD